MTAKTVGTFQTLWWSRNKQRVLPLYVRIQKRCCDVLEPIKGLKACFIEYPFSCSKYGD